MGDAKDDKCLQNLCYHTEYDLLARHALTACCQLLPASCLKPDENKATIHIPEVRLCTCCRGDPLSIVSAGFVRSGFTGKVAAEKLLECVKCH